MKPPSLKSLLSRIRRLFIRRADDYLPQVRGVIHVGANVGQEREAYEKLGLHVIWIEPISAVFEELRTNVSQMNRQRAIRALVTDRDNEIYQFHVANNNGASSSIFELKDHKDIWPEVDYTETISLKSSTLATVLKEHGIDPSGYDALVMDTQGSELLVLKGAEPILKHFQFVKTEAADFESYANCCQFADLDLFLSQHGFQLYARQTTQRHSNGGRYYEVTYQRKKQRS